MKVLFAVFLLTFVVVFTSNAYCERKCTGVLTVDSLRADKVAPGFIAADITFDSNSYSCTEMSFAKTEKPTSRVAILGFAPGTSHALVKPGAKLKVEYENIYVSPEETMGMGSEWEEKWTVLGAQDSSSPKEGSTKEAAAPGALWP